MLTRVAEYKKNPISYSEASFTSSTVTWCRKTNVTSQKYLETNRAGDLYWCRLSQALCLCRARNRKDRTGSAGHESEEIKASSEASPVSYHHGPSTKKGKQDTAPSEPQSSCAALWKGSPPTRLILYTDTRYIHWPDITVVLKSHWPVG